jgi:hypothetical protein
MQIRRRGVAPFATGVSTINYHMLPPCGTNPAWPQALAGRPAIAGCAPMLRRCGTSASPGRHPSSAVLCRFPAPITFHVSRVPFPIRVHLCPSVVKSLCALAPLRLCVKALSYSCVSCVSWSKIRGISVNSRKYLQLRYLQQNEPRKCLQLRYLRLIATNCTSCASCNAIFFLNLATFDFALRPRPSPCSKPSQNHPPSPRGKYQLLITFNKIISENKKINAIDNVPF